MNKLRKSTESATPQDTALRRRAEAIAREQSAQSPEDRKALSLEETRSRAGTGTTTQTLHELRAEVVETNGLEQKARVQKNTSELERLATIRSRLQVQIGEVQKHIAEGTPLPQRQPKVADTPQITNMRRALQELRKELADIKSRLRQWFPHGIDGYWPY